MIELHGQKYETEEITVVCADCWKTVVDCIEKCHEKRRLEYCENLGRLQEKKQYGDYEALNAENDNTDELHIVRVHHIFAKLLLKLYQIRYKFQYKMCISFVNISLASGGLRPLTPWPGALPLDPTGGQAPRPPK